MKALSAGEIRASFVNCTKGEASRAHLPADLAEQPWADLDFLGWRDPRAPQRGYLVAEHRGALRGVVLRAPEHGVARRSSICGLCVTQRSGGVSLLVAPGRVEPVSGATPRGSRCAPTSTARCWSAAGARARGRSSRRPSRSRSASPGCARTSTRSSPACCAPSEHPPGA